MNNFQQAPYGQKINPFQPMSIFSEDEVESIHVNLLLLKLLIN